MRNICSVDLCNRPVAGFGLCDMHYRRYKKHGDCNKVLRGASLSQHYFWERVIKTDSCWIWKGSINQNGYGRFGHGYKRTLAHRFSWALAGNKLEKGMVLDHLCRNPACVNPAHLQQVTQKENLLRSCRYNHELKDVGDYKWGVNRQQKIQSRINHLKLESGTNI